MPPWAFPQATGRTNHSGALKAKVNITRWGDYKCKYTYFFLSMQVSGNNSVVSGVVCGNNSVVLGVFSGNNSVVPGVVCGNNSMLPLIFLEDNP